MNNDLISREALKEALKSGCKPELCPDYNTTWCENCCRVNDFEDLIDNAPTVELTELCKGCQYLKDCETCDKSERPQGEWIEGWDGYFETLDCSLCGYVRNERHLRLNFCPNCGAKMKGGAV